MKKVAVILSGSGVYDGAELQESILTLLSLDRAGVSIECFAPNKAQHHVINHLTGEEDTSATRNVLEEAARINRGDVKDLTTCVAKDFDGLVVVGGFGVAKNLSNFAFEGTACQVDETALAVFKDFATLSRPSLYMCIAPALLPAVYGEGVELTIGNDPDTIQAIEAMGGKHIERTVEEIAVDESRNVISTPAYMLAQSISQAASGIENGVAQLVKMMK
ncbi:isoprenoid biosynthesis glyoxalase ElbB [Psychrobium sp. MM17-31]|uniref:isoprenoid biosynthesis glyoxalase ElbB n=1 Tax=Psychrobium sp. MM17-31 TaxID=2917758 RepID=UPI001EF63238|nr:isoprenoid biosynthesis glyoxalase ElbB [Psychrobium sp. MM17-31]MCG7532515.1 isoprenoid biosynthesis glyoxalase ElbB [Psychrobium sp. MM17-31]